MVSVIMLSVVLLSVVAPSKIALSMRLCLYAAAEASLSSKGGNQLPVSAARWQHGSQVCSANFYLVKTHKITKDSTTTKARETMNTDLESL